MEAHCHRDGPAVPRGEGLPADDGAGRDGGGSGEIGRGGGGGAGAQCPRLGGTGAALQSVDPESLV